MVNLRGHEHVTSAHCSPSIRREGAKASHHNDSQTASRLRKWADPPPFLTATGFRPAPSTAPLPSETAAAPGARHPAGAPPPGLHYAAPPCLARLMQYRSRTLCRIGASPLPNRVSRASRVTPHPTAIAAPFLRLAGQAGKCILQEDQEGRPLRHAGSGMVEPRESGILVNRQLGNTTMTTLLERVPVQLLGHARRGNEPRRVSRSVQARPDGVRHRGRAHACRHRRARARRHPQRSAPRPALRQPRHPALPGVPRVLRHGGRDRADRRVLQARGAGSRGEEADPLPAGPRRRRQVVDRRAAQGA